MRTCLGRCEENTANLSYLIDQSKLRHSDEQMMMT
jgi:hypothetical protein